MTLQDALAAIGVLSICLVLGLAIGWFVLGPMIYGRPGRKR